jgi:membrane fusion protein (multidrug efflux system)
MNHHPHHKFYLMKLKLTGLIIVVFLAVSCGSGKKENEGDLNDKKAELEKLKSDQKELIAKISKLEAEIKKADPTAISSTAKLVSVSPIGTEDFSHYIELQGRVDAQDISYVAPPNGQGGVVKALYISQGQSVRKGQVIARLDDQLIRQQIEPLKVQLAMATDTYNRTKNLWDQGIGSYQNVLSAKTSMESLQKSIGIIQKQVALMTVTAPTSGVIDQLNLRVGEMLSPMQNAQNPQIRIVNTGNLKAVAGVPENYLGKVNVGSRVEISLPEENNRKLSATVNVVQKVIDPNTRSFNIEAKIPSDANLKPNQIAQIRILDYSAKEAITVPLNVIQSDEKGKYVYVLEKTGNKSVARKRTVITGESYGDKMEVRSGLKPGDLLITEGYQNLYESQVITTQAL